LNQPEGHRGRLRHRFLANPSTLADVEQLELLLTYAIPRQDVAPLARQLLDHFGSLPALLHASRRELLAAKGIGEQTAVLIQLVAHLQAKHPADDGPTPTSQLPLPVEIDVEPPQPEPRRPRRTAETRTFTNDLARTARQYLPQAVNFQDIEAFQRYLEESLPYNSITSRKRYARNLLHRYYPDNRLDLPLTTLFSYTNDDSTVAAALFYETVRVEPAVQYVAEEIIWPALPLGFVTREQLRQRVTGRFAAAGAATIQRMVYSLLNFYTILGQAVADERQLTIRISEGTLPAFLYVLSAEFPEAGIYSFDALERGPMRRWLLWDRDWMRRQLYNLRDFGVISKVSEIDAMRQFTLLYDQQEALSHYFEHPQRELLALRERNEMEGENE
jgi:hypothetical protein